MAAIAPSIPFLTKHIQVNDWISQRPTKQREKDNLYVQAHVALSTVGFSDEYSIRSVILIPAQAKRTITHTQR
jgi:hypothetical protein